MHEYITQYGAMFVLYVTYIGLLQALSVIWMSYRHIRPRKNTRLYYTVMTLIFTLHDAVWSLFGYYEGSNKVYLSLEILLWCLLVYQSVKKCCIGNSYINFIHMLALEWINQMFGMICTFPAVMLLCGFDFEKGTKMFNEPSYQAIVYMTVIYFCVAGLSKIVWDFVCRHKGKYFHIMLLVFCLADIGALLLYGWRVLVPVFLACAFIIVTSFRQHNKNEKYLREQFAFYQELAHKQTQREKEISVIRHDIANHINVIEEMQKDDAGQKLLEKIDKANRNMTGIPVLDCVLREKTMLCEKHSITFIKSGTVIGETGITEYEFVSLFANLLDNAIEAAQKTEKKYVELKIEKQQGVLMITVSNSKQEKQRPLENEFGTTKKDKRKHGIGNRIIRDIVEAHGGRVTYHDQGDVMKVVALMQM